MKKILLLSVLISALFSAVAFAEPDADNTARNVRDRHSEKLSPLDQGNSELDLTITQQIRKAVVADTSLSMNAHNVKIITRDAEVTLRGPVKSPEEKEAIASIATKTTGVKRVHNEVEIERK